ncbi:DUF6508 domain-containing protein [Microbacterium sp. ZW T5_56]|uniref:DUF6508 domain-containing protein n=1 Tax=Microbacterium sp. ZW T5_56 TaxID=3378081 RepID=UPI003852533A
MAHQESATEHWEKVHRGRELLLSGYQVQWTPSRLTSSGAWTMPYPDYDEMLMGALDAASTILGPDHDYLASFERTREVPISSASVSDLSTWFTYIQRGERFADGHIAHYVESGEFLLLLDRLVALRDSLRIASRDGGGAREGDEARPSP